MLDPDIDFDLDLPSIRDSIPHDELKKLKSKEVKYQETVNELFHTERLHVRNLKIMKVGGDLGWWWFWYSWDGEGYVGSWVVLCRNVVVIVLVIMVWWGR